MKKASLFILIFASIAFSESLIACFSQQPQAVLPSKVTSTPIPLIVNPLSTSLSPESTTQTQIAFEQAMAIARSARQTEIALGVCEDSYSYPRYSPNGLWLEKLCYSKFDNGLIMTLSNSKTQVLWKLIYRDYIPGYDIVGDDGEISVAHWSNDGRYAYFNSYSNGSGGECYVPSTKGGFGLFRLDLETGEVSTILPLGKTFRWYGFSFSPTDRRLIYGIGARDFMILDLKTGDITNIYPVKEFGEGGGFLWSSDGLEFVYSTVKYNYQMQNVTYSLRLVDVKTGNERILFESEKSCYEAQEWVGDRVLLIEYDDENHKRALMQYDLNSNTTIDAPVSPAP